MGGPFQLRIYRPPGCEHSLSSPQTLRGSIFVRCSSGSSKSPQEAINPRRGPLQPIPHANPQTSSDRRLCQHHAAIPNPQHSVSKQAPRRPTSAPPKLQLQIKGAKWPQWCSGSTPIVAGGPGSLPGWGTGVASD